MAYGLVMDEEKGGWGKSTFAMHLITASDRDSSAEAEVARAPHGEVVYTQVGFEQPSRSKT